MSACWHVRPGAACVRAAKCLPCGRERERESAPAAARCCRTGIRQPGAGLSATSSPQARVQQLCDGSASPGSVSICGSATASSEMMPAVSPRGWATQPRARASLCREAAAAAARSRGLRRRPAVALLVAARLGARHAGRVLYPSEHEASTGQCRQAGRGSQCRQHAGSAAGGGRRLSSATYILVESSSRI